LTYIIQGYYGDQSPKEIIVEQQQTLYNKTEAEAEKRKHFEEAVSAIMCVVDVDINSLSIQ